MTRIKQAAKAVRPRRLEIENMGAPKRINYYLIVIHARSPSIPRIGPRSAATVMEARNRYTLPRSAISHSRPSSTLINAAGTIQAPPWFDENT